MTIGDIGCVAALILIVLAVIACLYRWHQIMVADKASLQVLTIPDDKMLLIAQLYDDYQSANVRFDKKARYLLWNEIAKIFPEVKTGNWTIEFTSAFKAQIIQKS
jgi:hypothetical protein